MTPPPAPTTVWLIVDAGCTFIPLAAEIAARTWPSATLLIWSELPGPRAATGHLVLDMRGPQGTWRASWC